MDYMQIKKQSSRELGIRPEIKTKYGLLSVLFSSIGLALMLLYSINLIGIWCPWKLFLLAYPLLICFSIAGVVLGVLAMKYNQKNMGMTSLIFGILAFILPPAIYAVGMLTTFLGNAPFLPWN